MWPNQEARYYSKLCWPYSRPGPLPGAEGSRLVVVFHLVAVFRLVVVEGVVNHLVEGCRRLRQTVECRRLPSHRFHPFRLRQCRLRW